MAKRIEEPDGESEIGLINEPEGELAKGAYPPEAAYQLPPQVNPPPDHIFQPPNQGYQPPYAAPPNQGYQPPYAPPPQGYQGAPPQGYQTPAPPLGYQPPGQPGLQNVVQVDIADQRRVCMYCGDRYSQHTAIPRTSLTMCIAGIVCFGCCCGLICFLCCKEPVPSCPCCNAPLDGQTWFC